ncbi:MAG: hypothetical protein RBT59_09425 [Arcobacteraceae bacterium]|jgi:hypothetical protein|nr:hypothetical protein [Arcobacteraceae bacterium]
MKKNRLFIFAHDAGSANVTMAYAYLKQNKYDETLAFPKGPAEKIYKQHIDNYISNKSFDFLPTDTVVTGTSGIHSDYEMEIIIKARKANVNKIITILDSTANFELRFSIGGEILSCLYLPDEIWVDNKHFISNIDYFNKHIIYKKNIYNLYIKQMFKDHPAELKNKDIITHNGKYLVVLTDYLSELYGDIFGFSEFDYLENILSTISELGLNIPIFIKLHPAESSNKYNNIISNYKHLNILKDDFNIHELIYYSAVVFGINSSVFKEALMLKKPTFSIQIGSKTPMATLLNNKFHVKSKSELIKILHIYSKKCYR